MLAATIGLGSPVAENPGGLVADSVSHTAYAVSEVGTAVYAISQGTTGSARADLAVKMSAPASLAHGASGTVTVTVTNNGPQAAAHVLSALYVSNGLRWTCRGCLGWCWWRTGHGCR